MPPATRRERDAADITEAHRLDEAVARLLPATRVAEVAGETPTRGPGVLALRTVARELNHREALALCEAADALYWAVALRHVGVGWRIARPMAPSADADDLHSAVYAGLYSAAIRFDLSNGCRFPAYAAAWIRTTVGREILLLGTDLTCTEGARAEAAFQKAFTHEAMRRGRSSQSADRSEASDSSGLREKATPPPIVPSMDERPESARTAVAVVA